MIDAFQATLQEAVDADLLLHVVDASNPHFIEQIAQVQSVLAEIGAADVPQILAFNKLDMLNSEKRPAQLQDRYEVDGRQLQRVFVSAQKGEGLTELRQQLAAIVLAAKVSDMTLGPAAEFKDDDL